MSDGTKRKLTMPPWHIPYLEKHRIYDLFHELSRELVIQQPVDHVLFTKQILEHATKNINVARVVLLSSPKINLHDVAVQLSYYTQQKVIDDRIIAEHMNPKKERCQLTPEELAKCLDRIARMRQVKGWILLDCIKNVAEAKAILQQGILPTHVIHFIPPFEPQLNNAIYSNVQEGWAEYRRSIMNIRDVFKHCLIEVHLGQKSMDEVVEECYEHIKARKGFGGPKQPRIVLLGPRGCGRKTQARLLEENLNIIHVDFEYLLCQAWISKTELGKKLRECQDDVCFKTNLLMKVIDQRILKKDCLEQGWVLTGFPFTVNDFRYLDCLDTPPNRVIFIDCDLQVCKERIVNRKFNMHTGSVIHLLENRDLVMQKLLATHPKDNADVLEAELKYYCEQYGSIKKYCGQTAAVINGNQPHRWVYETICAIIIQASPACPPRNPCKLETDSDSVCLDPCTCADDLLPKSYMHIV
ncbi:hypothetical protein RI129_001476 [Pyrocoelia pectoralis]|uniref:Adenylate kinase 8 n=1 Tax=Pyrocoelia pectoralis TaxID=417401 RepID=A0AAN7ZT75_9COLE